MKKVTFDYSKLKGRIKEKCDTQRKYAVALGINEGTLAAKLSNKSYFTQSEIEKSIRILNLDPGTVSSYFFTTRVEKT